jgi:hypothetical protein
LAVAIGSPLLIFIDIDVTSDFDVWGKYSA